MKLNQPFPTIIQGFGANAVSAYSGMGLKGHPGIDFEASWGTDIPASIDAPCYSVIRNTDPAFYQAVYTIYDDVDFSYEISYGHCSSISAEPGMYHAGDILAKVGNTGTVYENGVEVPEADKLAGSHAGSHLHFQVRKLKKVPNWAFDPTKHHINDGQGMYTTPDGFNYEVPDWDNGFNGCIDPAQFFADTSLQDTIKSEVQVLNQTTDPSVRQSFITLIIQQVRKLLGF